MLRSAAQLRDDALAIWHAGLAAVRSQPLLRQAIVAQADSLQIAALPPIDLREVERVVVVGGGKAGAGMAAGLEQALGEQLMADKNLTGWVNVPADCVQPTSRIHLHAARPAGVNEPTAKGVVGTRRILELVRQSGPRDLGIALISGGGSALLPAPVEGIELADKVAITRFLSGAGANIEQLNAVRKQISQIKGGGLARNWRGGQFYCLIISDVLGDPLDVIASGPTVANRASAAEALVVLEEFGAIEAGVAPAVTEYLVRRVGQPSEPILLDARFHNVILANIATAVDAAGIEAERRGYSHAMSVARSSEGPAEEVGRHHARLAQRMRSHPGPDCLITGGEPIVRLPPADERGRGGRNQQLALAALDHWIEADPARSDTVAEGICLLAAGTDGEDGPTDAAGALVDAEVARRASEAGCKTADCLRRCDAYSFFQEAGGLVITGASHTNVGDLRVVVVDRVAP